MKKNNAKVNIRKLKLPEDLKNLSTLQLEGLCRKIRMLLISTVSVNGGHLSSNLGVVELSVALHKVFDSPKDKLVWDVGHQSYTHKILTDRLDSFSTLRQEDGISGFLRPDESKHDVAVSGHSSTSVSTALGMAYAMKLDGDSHHAVAVIGDGALTGGLAYEGLNNAGKSGTNIIIILNHNEMSISKSNGAMAKYLSTLRTKESYIKTKGVIERVLDGTPVIGSPVKNALRSSKNALKNMILHSTMFEDLGFEFLGPVDGHNLDELIETLEVAKSMSKPVFVHVNTVKGKGYPPAEDNPGEFHGIGAFEISTGNPDVSPTESYSDVFGRELASLAENDENICAITAAMKYGTGLQHFYRKFPERFFDVGIAEEHALTFSAGLAEQGKIPVFAVYSSFLQRGYDQLLHDLAISGCHAVIGVDRSGIVGEDGETHQGVFDVAFLTTIPNTTIYSPTGYDELRLCLSKALYATDGIACVRYPKGNENPSSLVKPTSDYEIIGQISENVVVTYGRISDNAINAVKHLAMSGKTCGIIRLVKLFPISDEIIQLIKSAKRVFFFEEGMENGSISEKITAKLAQNGFNGKISITAINGFVKQAKVERALEKLGLDEESMLSALKQGITEH